MRLAYLVTLATLAVPALADMRSASDMLARGDAAGAFKEYEKLAQFGNATAQFNVGTMLLKGQGTPEDIVSGAAWLLVAKENAPPKSLPATDAVLDALSEEQASAARELANKRERDATALLPALAADVPNTPADHYSKVAAKASPQFYRILDDALRAYHIALGWAVVRVVVDPDGELVDVWVTEAGPRRQVEVAAAAAVRTMRFLPAAARGRSVASSFRFRLERVEKGVSAKDPKLKESFAEIRSAAAAGDPASRLALARTSMMFRELSPAILDMDRAEAWIRELANDPEQAEAMYVLPDVQYQPESLDSRMPRAEIHQWTLRSAQAGFAPAQLDMALMCWGERAADSLARARPWLESAAAAGFPAASRYLAALLLLPQYRQQEGARALQLVKPQLESPLYEQDPDTWQLTAAAYAAQGNFREAIAHESHAIALLPKKSLRAPGFAAHLAAFQSNALIEDELLTIPAAAAYR
jgi:TonB family protein